MITEPLDITRHLPTHESKEYPERNVGDIELVVIHHEGDPNPETESTPFDIARWHVEGLDRAGICYHSVVTRDGIQWKTNLDRTVSKHVGETYNPKAIGICATGNFDQEPPTQDQALGLLIEVLRYLNAYPDAKVVGHKELGDTSCPGEFLDMDKFRGAIDLLGR